jgi:hypothetical protein
MNLLEDLDVFAEQPNGLCEVGLKATAFCHLHNDEVAVLTDDPATSSPLDGGRA